MFEGSEALDFSKPAKDQTAVAGYAPGRSIVLVRNPSWDATTDELRPAYPDRIETTIGGTAEDIALKIDSGDMDIGLDAVPPANQVQQYTTDPDLKDRIHADPSDAVRFLEMNLASPPFDDIHIRKALNWALDKQGFLQLRGGPIFGEIAGHIMVNSLENNLLRTYDPYATPDGGGDIQKAKDEIAQSKYDANQDGVCDAPACSDVLTISDSADPYPKQLALLQQVLEPLGITLNPKPLERSTMYARCEDPNSHWALCTGPGWGKDYPDGFTFAPPLFSRSAIGPESCCNDTMVGVTPEMLTERGYAVTDVPSAETRSRSASRSRATNGCSAGPTSTRTSWKTWCRGCPICSTTTSSSCRRTSRTTRSTSSRDYPRSIASRSRPPDIGIDGVAPLSGATPRPDRVPRRKSQAFGKEPKGIGGWRGA